MAHEELIKILDQARESIVSKPRDKTAGGLLTALSFIKDALQTDTMTDLLYRMLGRNNNVRPSEEIIDVL